MAETEQIEKETPASEMQHTQYRNHSELCHEICANDVTETGKRRRRTAGEIVDALNITCCKAVMLYWIKKQHKLSAWCLRRRKECVYVPLATISVEAYVWI